MSIRKTTLLAIFAAYAGLFLFLYTVITYNILPSFLFMEKTFVVRELRRSLEALKKEERAFLRAAEAWRAWSEEDRAPDRETLKRLDADFALVRAAPGAPPRLIRRTRDGAEKLPPISAFPLSDAADGTSGVVAFDGGAAMFAAPPPWDKRGGRVVFGRLPASWSVAGRDGPGTTIRLFPLRGASLTPARTALRRAFEKGKEYEIIPQGEEAVRGFAPIRDRAGAPVMALEAASPRLMYLQGKHTLGYSYLALVIIGSTFGLLMLFLVERRILSRLTGLAAQLAHIRKDPGGPGRTEVSGSDEIAGLAASVNDLLDAVDAAGARRREAEESVRRLSRDLITAQEDERARIARDLHDDVAQELAGLKIKAQTLPDAFPEAPPGLAERMDEIAGELQRTLAGVRRLSYGLRPPDLEYLGLEAALAGLCREFENRTGIAAEFKTLGLNDKDLRPETAINIYRLVQEALANTAAHAGASAAAVKLLESHPTIRVDVRDDGRGFDAAEALSRPGEARGMGLRSMRERATLLGGSFRIESAPGAGTRIVADIPYK